MIATWSLRRRSRRDDAEGDLVPELPAVDGVPEGTTAADGDDVVVVVVAAELLAAVEGAEDVAFVEEAGVGEGVATDVLVGTVTGGLVGVPRITEP